jgi:hypothetical protein
MALFFENETAPARSYREDILKHRQCLAERRGGNAAFSSVGRLSDANVTIRQVNSPEDRSTADLRGAKWRHYGSRYEPTATRLGAHLRRSEPEASGASQSVLCPNVAGIKQIAAGPR